MRFWQVIESGWQGGVCILIHMICYADLSSLSMFQCCLSSLFLCIIRVSSFLLRIFSCCAMSKC